MNFHQLSVILYNTQNPMDIHIMHKINIPRLNYINIKIKKGIIKWRIKRHVSS